MLTISQNKESLDEKIINNWSVSIGTQGRIHLEYALLEKTTKEHSLKIEQYQYQSFIRFPLAITLFKEDLEDSLQFLTFPNLDQREISSTNSLERIHKEIRRRTRFVEVFPIIGSFPRPLNIKKWGFQR